MDKRKNFKISILAIFILMIISFASTVTSTTLKPVNSSNNLDTLGINTAPNNVIFRDDFDNMSSHWVWGNKYPVNSSVQDGIAEFFIPWATRCRRYVAGIMDIQKFWKYNNMKARIKMDGIRRGSRGWGFWDTDYSFNPFTYRVAWFMSNRGNLLYPLNGFWAICLNGILDIQIKRIRGYDICEWHEYEINWTEESVDFYIDGQNVAHFTSGVPQVNSRIHIWVDNEEWFFFPVPSIHQSIRRPTTLYIDYIEITE